MPSTRTKFFTKSAAKFYHLINIYLCVEKRQILILIVLINLFNANWLAIQKFEFLKIYKPINMK